jgi:hypothetical protein
MIAAMENAVEKIKVWFRFVPREGGFQQDTEGLRSIFAVAGRIVLRQLSDGQVVVAE